MLSVEGLKNFLFDCESIEKEVGVYVGFPGYSDRISKWGIHAIGLGGRIR